MNDNKNDTVTTVLGFLAAVTGAVAFYFPDTANITAPLTAALGAAFAWFTNKKD